MSVNLYPLARRWLFRLDAELAHERTLALLARWQNTPLQALWAQPRVADPITLAGLHFPNRVGLAAGLDKNARCLDGLAAIGFGFVEVGTVTPRAQAGNPHPRMFRLPQACALINRMGFNNEGLEAFIRHVSHSRTFARTPSPHTTQPQSAPRPLLGLNIGKNAITPIERAADDYVAALAGVYPWADYVTVNISSPNTKNLRALQSDEALDALLSAIASQRARLQDTHARHVPVFLKIAPDLDAQQIQLIAAALTRHGMDGVIATNTTVERSAVAGLPHANEAGGLSGAPVLAASNAVIAQLRTALGTGFPIIGAGGILSAADAVSKLQAGADVVQLYTGLIYEGPTLVPRVARALREHCAHAG